MATLRQVNDLDDEMQDSQGSPKALSWHWESWGAPLKRAVALLGLVLVVVALLFFVRQWLAKDIQRKLVTQKAAMQQAQKRLANSGEERRTIEQHLPLLQSLESRGIYGEEKRLEWIEAMRTIERRWPGLKVKYEIGAQTSASSMPNVQKIAKPPAPPTAFAPQTLPNGERIKKFDAFYTDMKLQVQILHEGDVFALIQDLQDFKLGHFNVQQCLFRRQGGSSSSGLGGGGSSNAGVGSVSGGTGLANADGSQVGSQANAAPQLKAVGLEAECVLRWVSMRTFTEKQP